MVAEGFVPEAGILSINHENRKEDERCDFSYIALKFDSAGQGPDGIVPGTEVPDGDACIPKGDAQKKSLTIENFIMNRNSFNVLNIKKYDCISCCRW